MGTSSGRSRWALVALWTLGVALMAATPGYAQESSRMDGVQRKLGRGAANVVSGPLEILRTPTLVGRDEGYISAMTVGLVHGVWRAIRRMGTGVFEVVTCFAEIPDGYAPLMQPEFVWAHGNWVE